MKKTMRSLRDKVFGGPLNTEVHDEYRYSRGRRTVRAVGRALSDRGNLIVASLAASALLGIAGLKYTSATVPVLGMYDCNQDGVRDAIVALPLRGTGSALLGYVDGNDLKAKNINIQEAPASNASIISVPNPRLKIDPFSADFFAKIVPGEINRHPYDVRVIRDIESNTWRLVGLYEDDENSTLATLP